MVDRISRLRSKRDGVVAVAAMLRFTGRPNRYFMARGRPHGPP
jgi:hypothetical protein